MSGSTTSIPIIPCMEPVGVLSDPRDILAYLLRYYTTAPLSLSDTTPNQMISLANDISYYQNDPNRLVDGVTQSLQSVYSNFFSPGNITVNVSTSDNGDNTYNLTIQLAASSNGNSYALGADVGIGTNGILTFNWHPSLV